MENEISLQEFDYKFNRGGKILVHPFARWADKERELEKIYFIIPGIIATGLGLFITGLFEAIGLILYGYRIADLPFRIIFSIFIFTYSNLKGSRHFS